MVVVLPLLHTLVRAAGGRRPRPADLDRMIADLRRRRLRGEPARPFAPPRGLSTAFLLRRLRALQLRKLRRTVEQVRRHVPWYARVLEQSGVRPRDLRSLEDLRRLPITRRSDLQDARDEFISRAPGLSPAVPLKTSGTTGKPLELFLTREEFDSYVAVQALSGLHVGFLGPDQIWQMHLSIDTSIAARIFAAAAVKAGSLVFPLGVTGDLEGSLQSLYEERELPGKRARVSGLFAAPGQLWALAGRAQQLGLAGRPSGLRRVFTCGAPVSAALRERVQQVWGLPLREAYSMVETPGTGIFECESGRLHFLDLSGLIELLDPVSEQPVPAGEPGIAVVTTFFPERELMPVLRYWSQDLLVLSPETRCECGMVSTLVERILGRADQMFVVGARNFFPHSLGDVFTTFSELIQPPRFRVSVIERPAAHAVVVQVEAAATLEPSALPGATRRIRAALPLARDPYVASGTVELELELVPAGSVREPFRYKLQGPALHSG